MHHPAAPAHRLVFGPGTDELAAWYVPSRWFAHTDERGSVVALTDDGGNLVRINRYDEYGRPNPNNWGWIQYTGQQWMNDVPIYYYKARYYQPDLGRFMQVDPIGYDDRLNLYLYARADSINYRDPAGEHPVAVAAVVKCATNAVCRTVVANGARTGARGVGTGLRAARDGVTWLVREGISLVSSDEGINDGPFETNEHGAVNEADLSPSQIGDRELDAGIRQLQRSIRIREADNNRYSRGNPGGGPEDQRNARERQRHLTRISNERRALQALESRKAALEARARRN